MRCAVSLEDFPDFDHAVNARLQKAAGELCAEFAGIFPAERVTAVFTESTRELSGGNVASFVPILPSASRANGSARRRTPRGCSSGRGSWCCS